GARRHFPVKCSWNWLGELVELPADLHLGEVASRLTKAGLEVESVTELGSGFAGVVVAQVRSKRPHPKAQKLTLVTVWAGSDTVEVVCGAPNAPEPGRNVLWARPGARLPDGRTLGVKAVGGVDSPGMLCSETELELGTDASGIIILDEGE